MSRRADLLQRYVERSAALDVRWHAIQRLEGEAYMNAVHDLAVEKARLRRARATFRPSTRDATSATPLKVMKR